MDGGGELLIAAEQRGDFVGIAAALFFEVRDLGLLVNHGGGEFAALGGEEEDAEGGGGGVHGDGET